MTSPHRPRRWRPELLQDDGDQPADHRQVLVEMDLLLRARAGLGHAPEGVAGERGETSDAARVSAASRGSLPMASRMAAAICWTDAFNRTSCSRFSGPSGPRTKTQASISRVRMRSIGITQVAISGYGSCQCFKRVAYSSWKPSGSG